MYHIFYVNKGYMLVVDPPALETVTDLQQCINDAINMEPSEQVLFLSGGDTMTTNQTLAYYGGAGTDTNPIFLVRRPSNMDKEVVTTREQEGINELCQNWRARVESLSMMPVGSTLVQQYVELGKYGMSAADTVIKFCAKVVSEHQHLNQGWMAVTGNLDECLARIIKRFEKCKLQNTKLETMRERGRDLLVGLDETFETMKKIVVPHELMAATSTDSEASLNADVSLFDYIGSKDSSYPLESVVDQVRDSLTKTCEMDLSEAEGNLAYVKELNTKPDYRDIRGIDKRLAMLDAKLRLLEELHVQMKENVNRVVQPGPAESSANVINDQRIRVQKFSENLAEFNKYATVFINSKLELLKNIVQRLAGWIKQAYDRLRRINRHIIVFDEQFMSLRQKMDVARQIREAPIMYVTAVAEVVRRITLQKEFGSWSKAYSEKCITFVTEENKLRTEFYSKLEKHFLRHNFHGMSDKFPNIWTDIPKFDQNLPRVTTDYLRDLRKTMRDMEEMLKVTRPDVYARLSVSDPSAPPILASTLRREESFFVREKTANIDTMNRNFPSTTWLSGDDNLEMSPSNNFFLTKAPGFCSNTSLNMDLATPTELNPLTSFNVSKTDYLEPELGTPASIKSSPMEIPSSERDGARSASEKSSHSHFRTPEDTFQMAYKSDSVLYASPRVFSPKSSNRMYAREQRIETYHIHEESQEEAIANVRQAKENVGVLVQHYRELRETVEEFSKSLTEESDKCFSDVRQLIEEQIEKIAAHKTADLEAKLESTRGKIQSEMEHKVSEETAALKQIIEHEKYLRKEKERELEEQKVLAAKQNDDLLQIIKAKDDLHADVLKLETEKSKLEARIEAEASVDYLSIELNVVEQILKRQLTNEEIEWIRAEIEKRKMLKGPNEMHESMTTHLKELATSSEYEKAYKAKMQFLLKGIEEKKNKELSKYREEIEEQLREDYEKYTRKLKDRLTELEDRIRLYENTDTKLTRLAVKTQASMSSDVDLVSMQSATSSMLESCMIMKPSESEEANTTAVMSDTEEQEEEREHPSVDHGTNVGMDEDEDITSLAVCAIGTQTRIRMKDMKMMVSLNDVHEGCSVLVNWDNNYKSYMVFCANSANMLYFVKEESLSKLGIGSEPRRAWLFAVVTNVELCQIRKEKNRYNLPLKTRFYRVELNPIPLEVSSSASSTGSSRRK